MGLNECSAIIKRSEIRRVTFFSSRVEFESFCFRVESSNESLSWFKFESLSSQMFTKLWGGMLIL